MKKLLALVLVLMMVASVAIFSTGCKKEEVKIEIVLNKGGDQLEVFRGILADFTKETGIQVELTEPGDDYEATMKTRMASGDLPDMWNTHGWSVIRYSEYLMPLEDQSWYSKIDDSLLPVITDSNGHIYVLPITEGLAGVLYNKDVIAAAGIDVTAIRTWEDFTAALATVKANCPDKTPLYMSCNGSGINTYALELMFPSYLTNADLKVNYADQLLNGTFDFAKDASALLEQLAAWADAGYMNEDKMTADKATAQNAVGSGNVAFCLWNTNSMPAILGYNPDTNLGYMPVPAIDADSCSYFGVGEGTASCFGIWKDTKHPEECKKLLEYFARPEVADKIAVDVDGGVPCLKDSKVTDSYSLNIIREAQEKFAGDIVYDNFFDRKYFPSGMWSVMNEASAALLDGTASENIAKAAEILQTNYNDLMKK